MRAGRQTYAVRARKFIARHERLFLVVSAALLSVFLLIAYNASQPPARQITQKDIDAAVLHTLDKNVLPSPEAKAFKTVQRSIVRVRQLEHQQDQDTEKVKGVGTGVVIVDKGIILTNLHVVAGAEHVQVVFFNGLESDAAVIALQPENDLAVLQAKTIPDDLVPATLRSTRDLALGDHVIAVGFPFGIGPSVSAGVISGLRREYHSPEGEQLLTDLIQFDAAANPGNSGGPLVTMDGEVVGIVTAILNPGDQGVFIGIGFAVPIENAAAAVGESPF
jgi:S1-C subfamily serine protease